MDNFTTRSYSSELRTNQKKATRALILEAVAELVAEGRIHNFTVQDVADRAGISYASVYKHFSSREQMVSSLIGLGAERGRDLSPMEPQSLDELPLLHRNFEPFEHQFNVSVANMRAQIAMNDIPQRIQERDGEMARLLERQLPSLEPAEVRRAAIVLRYLTNSHFWMTFRTRYGFSPEETASALEWAVSALVKQLKIDGKASDGHPNE